MRVVRYDPSRNEVRRHPHGWGELHAQLIVSWGDPLARLALGKGFLPPGGGNGYHTHFGAEEVHVVLGGCARFFHDGAVADLEGPVCVPCRDGESHAIANPGSAQIPWLNIRLAPPPGRVSRTVNHGFNLSHEQPRHAERVPFGRLDRALLVGVGRRRVWDGTDFRCGFGHWDHVAVASGETFDLDCPGHEIICHVLSGTSAMDGNGEELPSWATLALQAGERAKMRAISALELLVIAAPVGVSYAPSQNRIPIH
jgi:mannose-6-phosphate isomerase-like protein (cupin superfamily)